jgi:hypothetical protein
MKRRQACGLELEFQISGFDAPRALIVDERS